MAKVIKNRERCNPIEKLRRIFAGISVDEVEGNM